MKLLARNTALSGMCDRFVDVFLLGALAKILKGKLYYVWKENHTFNEHQLKTWNPARFEDYKLSNFTKYFTFPEAINFVSEQEANNINNRDFSVFHDYLGGIYSPATFHGIYCRNLCTKEEFETAYYDLVSNIHPTTTLESLIYTVPKPTISIHLRRGDKVTTNPDGVQIHSNDLEKLNEITRTCLDRLIAKSKKQPLLYFCSDTPEVKQEFEQEYQKKGCAIVNCTTPITDIEKTYVDLYLLGQSETILMSQKHSNFSLFASHMNRANLIYFFEKNSMISSGNFRNTILFRT